MKEILAGVFVLLTLSSCAKSPQQARKELVEMGLQFNKSVFYQVAFQCDSLPVENFITGGMEPGIGLIGAAAGGCLEIVQQLIDKTEDKAALANALSEVLEVEVNSDRLEIAKLLLQSGVDPNTRIVGKDSFLLNAVKHHYVEIAKLLLDKGANPNDADGNSSVLRAAASISTELTKLLLDKGANPNSIACDSISSYTLCTPLRSATKSGNIDTVQLLLDHGAKVNDGKENTSSSLRTAVQENQVEIVKKFLDKGVNVNDGKDGQSDILEKAINIYIMDKGNINIIKLLLDKGANPNTGGKFYRDGKYNVLYKAVDKDKLDLVKILLEQGANPNNSRNHSMALGIAVENENADIVKLLLDHNANPNSGYSSGYKCVLDDAIENENQEIINLLKAKGAKSSKESRCSQYYN